MAGAYARFRIATAIHARTGHRFPWGTLAVNLLGSLLLGLAVASLDLAARPALRGAITVGFVGALTTFSTFAAETVALLQEGRRLRAAVYVTASVGMGLAAIAAGAWIGGHLS